MVTTVSDLDALVIRCRRNRARSYLAESVVCLKAGACRAAIVIAWIAVVHDLVEKFEELALGGDKNAQQKVDTFQKLAASHDIPGSQAFERTILNVAHKEFELFGHLALADLERLRDDRHRCAHPSMLDGEVDYQPPPELARYHIISAVTHLLEHGPAQGKSAIERLTAELEKDYFPETVENTIAHLEQGPLKNPRNTLVRNFVVLLLKRYFAKDESEGLNLLDVVRARGARTRSMQRASLVLQALLAMHHEQTMDALAERLNTLMASASDKQRQDALDLVFTMPDLWSLLSPAQHNRLADFDGRMCP